MHHTQVGVITIFLKLVCCFTCILGAIGATTFLRDIDRSVIYYYYYYYYYYKMREPVISIELEVGRLIECITHAGHSFPFLQFLTL